MYTLFGNIEGYVYEHICRMIERVDSDSLPDDPMIELVFKQFPDLRKTGMQLN